ncbi:MAG: cytochrome b N-terminal domain-containing protein [Deltaproteobacteria bacterium]|nr:cytochrome b N-terminal domain-containing protein [Deltaproteobacteria bacterium]
MLFANKPGHGISAGISAYLPRLGLSALFMCLFSGIVLTFYYRPMGNVFQNVEEITTLVPYGWFFRQLHFASGQLFVILMLIHAVDHFHRKRYRLYPGGQWQRLIFSLCLCFYTLFTGFILKGDKEGLFAAKIFMGITGDIPLVGKRLSSLFIQSGEALFFLPYLYHCFFLPILILYLIRTHIRRWFPEQGLLYTGAAGLCLYALCVKPFMDIPPDAFAVSVTGPWFFLGLQTLLKTLPATLAGIVLPGLFLCCVLILPYVEKAGVKSEAPKSGLKIAATCLHWLIVLVFLSYTLLTLKAAFWGP